MPAELIDYRTFSSLRDNLASSYSDKINMSSNAKLVFDDVYMKNLEDGKKETIPQRMAAIAIDVASADLEYLPKDMSYEQRMHRLETTARQNLELYVSNTFRANTPTNINFGRWKAEYNGNGEIETYSMKDQMGSACFVIPIEDTFGSSVEELDNGILEAWVTQQQLQKGGGGTGFGFSAIRPKGSKIGYDPVKDGMKSISWDSPRGVSSGYESFLNFFYNQSTDAVKQGNSRRGANMGVQRVDHMDFLDHMFAKSGRNKDRSEYRIKNFNLSLGVTDDFMESAEDGGTYTLFNPHRAQPEIKKILENKHGVKNPELVRKEDIATKAQFESILKANSANPFAPVTTPNMYLADNGNDIINAYTGDKIGTVMNDIVHIDATKVLKLVSKLSHGNGEPGLIFIDRINEYNPLLFTEEIDATNPCGEQPLMAHEACNLGSINLGKFAQFKRFNLRSEIDLESKILDDPFTKITENANGFSVSYFNWESLDETIQIAARFLDNVVDRSDFPSQKVKDKVHATRKIGLGYMGVWDAMVLMRQSYGSEESYEFAEALAKRLHDGANATTEELAEERGTFPWWEQSFYNPESELHNWFISEPKTIPDRFRGERKLSDRVDRERKMKYGFKARNSYQTTQAPTGTIRRTTGLQDVETGLDNLAISSGIEPIYSLWEKSNIMNTSVSDFSYAAIELFKREGIYSEELVNAIKENGGSVFVYDSTPSEAAKILQGVPQNVKEVLVTAAGGEGEKYEISHGQHARMASTFQKYNRSAISKTNNMPESATVKDMKEVWMNLWKSGSKGGTVYRDSSRSFQILNIDKRENGKEEGGKIRRPLLQDSITLELPYISSSRDDNGGAMEPNPDRCFTTITFNSVNGNLTGVFQNVAETDPERNSLIIHSNIELSRTLKNGRSLDSVIAELEKINMSGTRKGIISDDAVKNGSTESLRFQVDGGTTREDLLKTLYVTRFLTESGKNLNSNEIHEKMKKYQEGEITLRSIINTHGYLELTDKSNGKNPSILGHEKHITIPEGMAKSLCPECG
jgi:ribonucleoside-diphosphate reductase alpha chain